MTTQPHLIVVPGGPSQERRLRQVVGVVIPRLVLNGDVPGAGVLRVKHACKELPGQAGVDQRAPQGVEARVP